MVFSGHVNWPFAFGVLGNIISFIVFLSPMPTFYKMYKKRSTEGYQSIPYVVGLFSALLWIYYALVKAHNTTLLITINAFGCFIETIYIAFFLVYSTHNTRMHTTKVLVLFVGGGSAAIVGVTQYLFKGAIRVEVVGWICLVFALCVFVAPLGILRQVIKTKSVENMPLLLSVFLTLSAVIWFFYGFFQKDMNITVPNVLGFFFGIVQIGVYVMYKDKKKEMATKDEVGKPQPAAVIILEADDENNCSSRRKQVVLRELSEEQIIDIVKLIQKSAADHLQLQPAAAPNAAAPRLQSVET
ncbi:unnamed protein product [Cuscuta epithymum]|uniref:Bidirectional sugar transporter SWEET n=1 Tax=Cuscuta epithymum TaxID=186058 RepID=A0AAV0G489_9ASTE|nr:unnamed protein product [Cuscuta epithymum]